MASDAANYCLFALLSVANYDDDMPIDFMKNIWGCIKMRCADLTCVLQSVPKDELILHSQLDSDVDFSIPHFCKSYYLNIVLDSFLFVCHCLFAGGVEPCLDDMRI
jgi:hypothetical protein